MNAKNLYPRGSEWRRWDLHVHSPFSALNNQYPKNSNASPDWNCFIDELEKVKCVSVIGITDYFFIDGYKELLTLTSQGRLRNFDLILPNVELRLDTFVVRNKSKDINFHVIFSNDLKVEDIEKEFIEALDIQVSGSITGLDGVRKLNKRTLSEVGRLVKKYNQTFCKDSDEEAAFKNVTVSLKQVQELLRKSLFKGKFLFVLSGHEWAHIDWKQAYLTKKNFLQTADMLETGSSDTIDWALGKKDISRDTFIDEFGALKPCIYGSDAHSLETICKPGDDKFCWIKADPTFEGLKQVIYEPEERVYIGNSPPKGKNQAKVIDKIEIKDSNNWFEETPILLNDNLVSIIGEKGAGKTALADFIALAAGDFDVKEEDPASFIFKALKSSKQIQETIKNCVINISWRDGSSDSIKITEDLEDYLGLKKVRYLSQSFIERKCRPDQAGELEREVENIIFQYIPEQDRLAQTTFIDLKKKKTHSIQLKKSKCRQSIIDLNHDIFNLEEQINSLNGKIEEKSNLQAEIKQLEEQKPKPKTEEEKTIEAKLLLLSNRRNQLNEQLAGFKIQLNTIETIKTKVEGLKEYVMKQLTDIKNDLDSVGLGKIFEKLEFSVPSDFNHILDNKKGEIECQIQYFQGDKGPKEQNFEDKSKESMDLDLPTLTVDYISKLFLNKVNTLISALESKSSLAEDKRKTIKSFEEKIEKNQKRVNELETNIAQIEQIKKPLFPAKIIERDATYINYFILLQEEKKILEELYAPLRQRLAKENLGEKNQIEFFARIELGVEELFRKADAIIDFNRAGRYYRKSDLLFREIKTISEKIELVDTSDVYNLIAHLYSTFGEDGGFPIDIRGQLLRNKKKIDFYNWIYDVCDFNVTYSIKFQGTNIELLSPGKKGIVLLLMYLVLDTESSVPLVIDQPEENLDNKSIYAYLINYFKAAKRRRQIIVITHNPNLVLNTDAEQIIVANFETIPSTQNCRIRYISGAIENSFISEKAKIPLERQGIKEHGIDILEGGPVAFGKREDRYEIKRLIK